MYILSGHLKGRKIIVPDGATTRPTLSRVRQILFDILSHSALLPNWSQVSILDVFAGSGSIGIEALSRGAARAGFFERDPNARQVLQRNIQHFGLEEKTHIFSDAENPTKTATPYDIVFFDPPYDQAHHLAACVTRFRDKGWCHAHSMIITQVPTKTPAFAEPIRSKTIGVTRLDFYTDLGFSSQTGT